MPGGQPSFRRLLLMRILLLSIPILLLGVAVTFRKARTSLLETARQNLTESAIRKGNLIQSSIDSLQTSLAIASQTESLQAGDMARSQLFLEKLLPQLPGAQCLQLTDLYTDQIVASTCGSEPIKSLDDHPWRYQPDSSAINPFQRSVLDTQPRRRVRQEPMNSQLDLVISTPVYTNDGRPRYGLTVQTVLRQIEVAQPWSLLGYTTVIDQDGTFLSHPFPEKVGRNIAEEGDRDRFENILENTARGDGAVRHLFNFSGDSTEWLAGFTPIEVSISPAEKRIWTVLAVTRLDYALEGLKSISQILALLTGGLLTAHMLAMLYIARDISLPIEKLGKYARHLDRRDVKARMPKNFQVRELNQLAEVLNSMVSRLEDRANELESAWQEAEAANQLKSEFLATTSHELRTPLNAIIGCIRLVQDGYCDTREEELDLLEQADKAAIHLLKIINDLLDIRGIEQGKLRLFLEVVDLRQILKEVLELQAVEIQRKQLRLTAPDLDEQILVRADPARLKQVLLNVVSNAVKFTDEGSITIDIRRHQKSEFSKLVSDGVSLNGDGGDLTNPNTRPQDWIVVSVKDTGIGVDPEQQDKLFRPFVMADGSTTRKFEGTGLGLAISRNLVERMGGTIDLYSEGLDKGTTVEITLPVVDDSQTSTFDPDTKADTPERIKVSS
ncbi:sensor histidine kinase [Thermoleptolyngbya sp. PKUAC-SCTB121]|uniref:sensor histidine kinase n=1 Tax=Thermoleptolyngbya sp. PKUAC-SCTB121 TaxID=2811482 RepID=UPI001965ACB5|nr:sensor histidine kinase [Thermoleptolyngbya sp. PKUAC-SCTB121]